MKIIRLTLFLLFSVNCIQGQIKNTDFETPRDTLASLPNDWNIKEVQGFSFSLNSTIKHSGSKSFELKNIQKQDTVKFIPFNQTVPIDVTSLKKVAITAYIKTEDINGNVGLWCQVWDNNKGYIGFQNLEMQNIKITGTNDWKIYKLILSLDKRAKKLIIGGYLQGTGTVWFDDFSIEDIAISNELPSKRVKKYITDFNKIVKTNSVFSDALDWNTINTDLDILSKGLKTTEDAHILANYVMTKLAEAGDNHSLLISKKDAAQIAVQNIDGRQPTAKLLGNNIGYIYVPGFESSSDTSCLNFATKIQTLIKDLDSKNEIKGWIVDLRENTGGNMYPMIAGLGPLIGDGILGNFILPRNNTSYSWYYSKGAVGAKNIKFLKIIQPYVLRDANTKIAVLIGSKTSSSGEMTAISFIGKSNAKLFGEPTGGYTTGNQGYKLSDGSYLILASSFVSDRNNKKYLGAIPPDVFVEEKGDNKILSTAEEWLSEN